MAEQLPRGFLALPRPEDTTLARLTRKLRLLVLRRLLITSPRSLPAPLSGALGRLQPFLQQLARDKTGAPRLLAAIGAVDVLVPLLCAEGGQLPLTVALQQTVPTLLLALSRALPQRSHREMLLWDVPVAAVTDIRAGRTLRCDPLAQGLLLDGPDLQLRTAAGEDIELSELLSRQEPGDSLRTATSAHPIIAERTSPQLALRDTNPLSMLEEHPDKHGNAVDLGERAVSDWTGKLREALALIELALPALHRELGGLLQRVVPVGYEAEKHLSASYREAPGLVYLSLHPSTLTMAEALIHECQHSKLNTLRWFDAVLHNADSTWSPSPVRPDMRPLMGVLMGVHAFVPVAALHLRLQALDHPLSHTPHFARRRSEVLDGNRDGLATLDRLAQPTAGGERVLAALHQLHDATG